MEVKREFGSTQGVYQAFLTTSGLRIVLERCSHGAFLLYLPLAYIAIGQSNHSFAATEPAVATKCDICDDPR